MHGILSECDEFAVLREPESNILCFRYVGTGAADGRDEQGLDALNLRLREEYNRSGHGWITTTVLGGRRVLRVTIMNPRTSEGDVGVIVDSLRTRGRALMTAAS